MAQPHHDNTLTQTHASMFARLAASPSTANPAWAEFVERYGDLIRSFCRSHGLQTSDTEDVVQDVLLGLNKAMPGFAYDPSKGRFRGYLKTATLHAIYRTFRQDKAPASLEERESMVVDANADAAIDERWERAWRQYHLRRAFATMSTEVSSRDLQAFERYALQGEDAGVLAKELGLSLDALYQIKSRCTKRLAVLVEKQVEEEG
jgi:RNA polymerase sigma-70 factor (ECF subfamily)